MNTDKRQSELARIHIMKKHLSLDDETYRDMLYSLTGKDSARTMTDAERRTVIDAMEKSLGNKARKGNKHRRPPTAREREPLISKIGALLAEMQLPWSYADAIARKQWQIDLVQWCDTEQLRGIVTALALHHKRRASV